MTTGPGRSGRLAAVAASVLLAAGCGTSTTDDPVRERWESRREFVSCGAVRLHQGEEMRREATREIACLRRALAGGGGAELKVTRPTVEGDLVHRYYRLTPQGRLEVYNDSTADRYSDGKWTYAECHRPEWLSEISCP